MGLTDNQQQLIRAIANDNIQQAKKCALDCVIEDTTQKNQYFCKKYRQVLENSGGNLIELPDNLKGILQMEDVSNSFRDDRYYLSDREKSVFDNIVRMKKVNEKLIEIGIPYINSTLLYGESGTGKTTFGRYVAYKTGLPFCYLNFSNLIDSYMGSTSKNISKAFNYAISTPCVFMLDEVDCISIKRSETSGNSSGEMARITITLMQEFDRLPNNIVVIGATNRIDRIDEALLRRFSLKHKVETLSYIERINLLNKFVENINMKFSDEEIREIAEQNENQSMLLNELIRRISQRIYEEILNE